MKRAGNFLLIIILFLLSSCDNRNLNNTGSAGKIKVTDFRGKEISLNQPACRIVCLIESALSGIYMLHAENRISGISVNVYNDPVFTYYAQLDERIRNKKIPAPGNWDFVNIESVIALKPDLVIIWQSQTEAIEALENKDIPVYAVMIKSIRDIYEEMKDLGILTSTSARADSLINMTKKSLSEIKAQTAGIENKKSIYFSWAQGLLETSGKNSTVNELIEMAGCINVCNSPDEHLTINKEQLIEWNPGLIISWVGTRNSREEIEKMKEYLSVSAVKNNMIFEIPSGFLCDLWTLKFVYAVKLLNYWAYGNKGSHPDKSEIPDLLYGKSRIKLPDE